MLAVAVAQFCSGIVVIRYVLPVLWIMSCFHIMGLVIYISKVREDSVRDEATASVLTRF